MNGALMFAGGHGSGISGAKLKSIGVDIVRILIDFLGAAR